MRRWHLQDDLEDGINFERLCCNSAAHSNGQRHTLHLDDLLNSISKWRLWVLCVCPAKAALTCRSQPSGAEESLQSCRGADIYCMHAANRVVSPCCRFHAVETDQATSHGERKSKTTVWSQITNRWYWNESLWIKCPTYCSLAYCTSIRMIIAQYLHNGEFIQSYASHVQPQQTSH